MGLFQKKNAWRAAALIVLVSCLAACGKASDGKAVKGQMETADIWAVQQGMTQLTFSTTDINGNEVTGKDYSDAKVILVNFWEPWCAPCISEMPDLETLYENYREQGLEILGAFGTADSDEDAETVIEECGTTYPVLHATTQMRRFSTAYIPTTIIVDGDGNLLSEKAVIGAHSYEDWEKLVNVYLDEADNEK